MISAASYCKCVFLVQNDDEPSTAADWFEIILFLCFHAKVSVFFHTARSHWSQRFTVNEVVMHCFFLVIESEEKNGKKMQMSRWLCTSNPLSSQNRKKIENKQSNWSVYTAYAITKI